MTAAAVRYPTLTERAEELRNLAGYVHDGSITADLAERCAVGHLIAATLPNPADVWADYCQAVGRLLDVQDGVLPPSELGVVCGCDRQQIAADVARDDVERLLGLLLYGPGGAA